MSHSLSNNVSYHPPVPQVRLSAADGSELAAALIDNHKVSRCQLTLVALCIWAAVSDGVEIMCLSFVLPHVRCEMDFSAVELSLLSSVVFIGLLVGGFVWGIFGDKWGRKNCLVMSLAMNGVFGLLSS